jgi:hypothetical protein
MQIDLGPTNPHKPIFRCFGLVENKHPHPICEIRKSKLKLADSSRFAIFGTARARLNQAFCAILRHPAPLPILILLYYYLPMRGGQGDDVQPFDLRMTTSTSGMAMDVEMVEETITNSWHRGDPDPLPPRSPRSSRSTKRNSVAPEPPPTLSPSHSSPLQNSEHPLNASVPSLSPPSPRDSPPFPHSDSQTELLRASPRVVRSPPPLFKRVSSIDATAVFKLKPSPFLRTQSAVSLVHSAKNYIINKKKNAIIVNPTIWQIIVACMHLAVRSEMVSLIALIPLLPTAFLEGYGVGYFFDWDTCRYCSFAYEIICTVC